MLHVSSFMFQGFMQIKPLRDHVVIEPLKQEEISKGGIVLPDTASKERPEQGKVVAVGIGKTLDNGQKLAPQVKVGDKVLFTKYGPNEVKVDEKEYLVCKEEDILAVLE